jgi:hypothetical protein
MKKKISLINHINYIINGLWEMIAVAIIFLSIQVLLMVTAQVINKGCHSVSSILLIIMGLGFGWAVYHLRRVYGKTRIH